MMAFKKQSHNQIDETVKSKIKIKTKEIDLWTKNQLKRCHISTSDLF